MQYNLVTFISENELGHTGMEYHEEPMSEIEIRARMRGLHFEGWEVIEIQHEEDQRTLLL